MSFSPRSDLAMEARETYLASKEDKADSKGVIASREDKAFGIAITRVKITDSEGEAALGKKQGSYITVEIPDINCAEREALDEACRLCSVELSRLIGKNRRGTVLVLGLGNRDITPDAIGPKATEGVIATRHLIRYMPKDIDSRLRPVSAVIPGVLGITGVETGEIVMGLCDKVKPSLVIAVDALCARSIDRINSCIQITDTGIVPGAGVGNRRMAIDEETLGVPVIALGVPTVIDASTIVNDTFDRILSDLKGGTEENSPLYKMLSVIEEDDRLTMIRQVLSKENGFIVTPKEIDKAVSSISEIISNSINLAMHKGLTLDEISRYK